MLRQSCLDISLAALLWAARLKEYKAIRPKRCPRGMGRKLLDETVFRRATLYCRLMHVWMWFAHFLEYLFSHENYVLD